MARLLPRLSLVGVLFSCPQKVDFAGEGEGQSPAMLFQADPCLSLFGTSFGAARVSRDRVHVEASTERPMSLNFLRGYKLLL